MPLATASPDRTNEAACLLRLLNRLPDYLENSWRDVDEDHGYFGDGSCGENGIRTNSSLVFAIAVLLTREGNEALSHAQRDRLTGMLGKLLRYLTAAHVTGTGQCATGGQWGLNWQSSWWASKLALGAWVARDLLTPAEWDAVCALVVAEADRHLTRLIPTGLAQDTKAEETAWDAEILAVALALLPGHAQAPQWHKRLIAFGINTFSRPSDRDNHSIVDGYAVRDLLRSCNIHEDGTLENHGTTHFCYVASPLISKTWCAFALHRAQEDVPAALAHNVAQVWQATEPTFLANRFAYVGGQDWARYTYGEYFILPALLYLDTLDCGTCTDTIFRRRLQTLETEALKSSDGSFFGARFTLGRYAGQFAKYETDCFACVALALEMLGDRARAAASVEVSPPSCVFVSPESLSCYARNADRFMSFAWSTLTNPVPNVTFVPLADDSLSEWHEANLIGAVFFAQQVDWVGVKAMEATGDGLRVEGSHSIRGARGAALAEHQLSLTLTATGLQIRSRYTAQRKLAAVHLTGLNWRLPNDVFNGFTRRFFFEGPDGATSCFESVASRESPVSRRISRLGKFKRKLRLHGKVEPFANSGWVNVDDKLGLVMRSSDALVLRRYPQKEAPWNSLNVEQIEAPAAQWRFNVPAGTVLLETDCLLHLGTHEETRHLAEQ
jgi:hypothetical protein